MWSKLFGNKAFVIVSLLFLAFVVARIGYAFFTMPQSYTPDEASILLNAQLLSEQGVDEWGVSWPLVYQSFGDSKLPGYLYSVYIVGFLTDFSWQSVRIPSFIASLLLPIAVWFLARSLRIHSFGASIAAVLCALSPWLWHYGSSGFEANLALLFWILGMGLIFHRPFVLWKEFVAGLLLFVSILTYNAPLLLLPSLVLGVIFWRWGNWKEIFRAVIVVVFSGLIAASFTLGASTQKGAISIFQDPTILSLYPAYRAEYSGIWQKLLGNQYVYFLRLLVERWVVSWSWTFLVTRGGANPWHTIPGTGHVHALILVILGLFAPLVSTRWYKSQTQFTLPKTAVILAWLLVTATAPAVITVDAPHATRSLFFFVMLAVAAGAILGELWIFLREEQPRWSQRLMASILGVLVVWITVLWWSPAGLRWQYFMSPRWNGNIISVLQSESVQAAQQVFVVDPHGSLAAYVGATDAKVRSEFVSSAVRSAPDTVGMVRVEKVGKYTFVLDEDDIPTNATGIILSPRSNTQWDIVEL